VPTSTRATSTPIVAAIAIAATAPAIDAASRGNAVALPLVLAVGGVSWASLITMLAMRWLPRGSPALALRARRAAVGRRSSSAFAWFAVRALPIHGTLEISPSPAIVVGAIGGVLIGLVTSTTTSSHPIRQIAKAFAHRSRDQHHRGPGSRQAVGSRCRSRSVRGHVVSARVAGFYGIALGAVGMLGHGRHHDDDGRVRRRSPTTPGGIAEMAHHGTGGAQDHRRARTRSATPRPRSARASRSAGSV
jgi:Na+/H+-translocating membrane pyrophosphatase